MTCLQKQSTNEATPRHGAWKLAVVRSEMQTGNANQCKRFECYGIKERSEKPFTNERARFYIFLSGAS